MFARTPPNLQSWPSADPALGVLLWTAPARLGVRHGANGPDRRAPPQGDRQGRAGLLGRGAPTVRADVPIGAGRTGEYSIFAMVFYVFRVGAGIVSCFRRGVVPYCPVRDVDGDVLL